MVADYLTYSKDCLGILFVSGEMISPVMRIFCGFFMLTAEFGKSFKQLIETQIQGLEFFFKSISYVYVLIIVAPSLYLFL